MSPNYPKLDLEKTFGIDILGPKKRKKEKKDSIIEFDIPTDKYKKTNLRIQKLEFKIKL